MKTLLITVITLLAFAVGWSGIQSEANHRLEKRLAGSARHQEASQAALEAAENRVGELQSELEKVNASLANATAKISRLETGSAQQTKELAEMAEALKTKQQEVEKFEQQAGKSAQDRAWWANYRATVARNLASRTVWQNEQNKVSLQQAQQNEIIRQNRAKEQLEAEANANERLAARAAMQSAEAAMLEARKPIIIIQNSSCQPTPNYLVSGGGYWQTHY